MGIELSIDRASINPDLHSGIVTLKVYLIRHSHDRSKKRGWKSGGTCGRGMHHLGPKTDAQVFEMDVLLQLSVNVSAAKIYLEQHLSNFDPVWWLCADAKRPSVSGGGRWSNNIIVYFSWEGQRGGRATE